MHGHSRWPLWLLGGACALLGLSRWQQQRAHEPLRSAWIGQLAQGSDAELPVGTGADDGPRAGQALHGGPARRHRAPGTGPLAPQIAWRVELGSPIEAQPVFSGDHALLYVVTLGGDVVALDAQSGAERWRHREGKRLYGAPVVREDGSLLFGADGGAVVALAADGKVRFRYEAEGDCDVALSESARGEILAVCGRSLQKLSAQGQLLARVELPKKAFAALAHDREAVYVGAQDGLVRAFSLGDLAPRWQRSLAADVDGGVALTDAGDVVVGTDAGEVVQLSARDGSVVWRTKVGYAVRGPLSVARNGDVLAGVFGKQPALVRLDAEGRERYRVSTLGSGADEFGVRGGALEDASGALFFGAQDDALYALTPNGTVRFRLELGGDLDAPLALRPDGRLYAATYAGSIVCLTP